MRLLAEWPVVEATSWESALLQFVVLAVWLDWEAGRQSREARRRTLCIWCLRLWLGIYRVGSISWVCSSDRITPKGFDNIAQGKVERVNRVQPPPWISVVTKALHW